MNKDLELINLFCNLLFSYKANTEELCAENMKSRIKDLIILLMLSIIKTNSIYHNSKLQKN
jgi:hypothetical protein